MTMNALVLAPFAADALDRLSSLLSITYESWLDTRQLADPEALARRIERQSFAIVVVEADFLPEEVFQQAPSLRLVGVCRRSLSHLDLNAATRHGVAVVNTPGRNAQGVAELTIALMLTLARRLHCLDSYVKQGQWQDPVSPYITLRGSELGGKTLGIIGFGQVGQRVARLGYALDMTVLVYDPYLVNHPLADQSAPALPANARYLQDIADYRLAASPASSQPAVSGSSSMNTHLSTQTQQVSTLAELLRASDYISINVPDTPETSGMIDRAMLALAKPGCRLINTSSYQAVDEAALVEALHSGRLAGAAFDVFETHPLMPTSPLLALDNVVLTPHIGGATAETIARHSWLMVEDIERFIKGQRPVRLVNPEVWRASV